MQVHRILDPQACYNKYYAHVYSTACRPVSSVSKLQRINQKVCVGLEVEMHVCTAWLFQRGHDYRYRGYWFLVIQTPALGLGSCVCHLQWCFYKKVCIEHISHCCCYCSCYIFYTFLYKIRIFPFWCLMWASILAFDLYLNEICHMIGWLDNGIILLK